MKKKVLVVAGYTKLPGDLSNNRSRFKYICELLSERQYAVTEIVSTFNELDKKQREISQVDLAELPYKVQLIDDPGYKKNISLERIYSLYKFGKNLSTWLEKNIHQFDLIYCCMPFLQASYMVGVYAKKHHIPFIIDIQDVWPEAMRMALDIPVVSDMAFYPIKRLTDKTYRLADGIVAVSDTYVDRARKVNLISKQHTSVYLGTEIAKFDEGVADYLHFIKKPENEFWITYIGSLAYSYDIDTLIEAMQITFRKGFKNIRLVVLGKGPLEMKFKKNAEESRIDALFTGWVHYGMLAAYLAKSDIAINSICKKSASSVVNKVGDYFAAGIPVLNGSLNAEMRNLVTEYKAGLNYEPENAEDLADKIILLYQESEVRQEMGCNARRLAEEKFDKRKSYPKIINLIENAWIQSAVNNECV